MIAKSLSLRVRNKGVILPSMGFSGLMSALLALSHAAAPPSDPERCRAAVSEAQALLAAVDADPDSYENVEETRASLRRTIAEARCEAAPPPEVERPNAVLIDDRAPRHEVEQSRIRPAPGDSGRGPASALTPVPAERRKGIPPGAATTAAGLLLALGGLAWSIKGRAAAEGAWRDVKRSMAVGAMLFGIVVASYGGYLLYGALSVSPGLALTGGGTLAPAIAVEGAALAEGAVMTAAGAKLASDGYSYAKSQRPSASHKPGTAQLPQHPSSGIQRPSAKDAELQNMIDQLFRSSDRLRGGTAGAVRNEFKTGLPSGGKFHLQKAQDSIRALERILKRANLDPVERATAEAMREDLQAAVNLATKGTP